MKLLILALAAIMSIYSVSVARSASRGTGSPCLAHPDSIAIHQSFIWQQVSAADSAKLATLGLPYRPVGGVQVVSDSLRCQQAIDSYNSTYVPGDTALHVHTGYLFEVGSTNYALALEGSVYVFFDTSFGVLVRVVGLK